jgi:hypothetical protein
MPEDRVLVVTGGLLTARDPSWTRALRRQLGVFRGSSSPWLDVESKLQLASSVIPARLYLASNRIRHLGYSESVSRFFASADAASSATPELAEVVLATLLRDEGMPFEVTTYADLSADPARCDAMLAETNCVFASTTLLRDSHELQAMAAMLKRPHNHVVAGGALVSLLHETWSGSDVIDVLAVGYGEFLVPPLCRWIRRGFHDLEAPPTGRSYRRAGTDIVHGGVPTGTNLDALITPDWSLAERVHGRAFDHVHYESVRGCPYRCAFCNYPYLFDDHRFRYRSATRIADDFEQFAERGVRHVTCLDSLFTMPKRRLVDLCEQLLARGVKLTWTCYARSDDLADIAVCELMKSAGCSQVQIGFESGSQAQLDRMNKRVRATDNELALRNCRRSGITSMVSVIVGYPGETRESLRATFESLRNSPPDLYFLAPFNVRVQHVPVLGERSRRQFGLRTGAADSAAPYWTHDTMRCDAVVQHVAWLHDQLVEHRVALEGALFYDGMRWFSHHDRDDLLDFQRDAALYNTFVRSGFDVLLRFANRRLRAGTMRTFGAPGSQSGGSTVVRDV